jgi:hypothetical protein
VQADFSIECDAEDACLEIPWASEDGSLTYCDLRRNPDLIEQLSEVRQYPELREFLRAVNSQKSVLQSAKCDAWFTSELLPEEDVFGTTGKFGSYVDLVFVAPELQVSFEAHESAARDLVELLKLIPEALSSVELLVRRCFFHDLPVHDQSVHEQPMERDGFFMTCYVFGYGNIESEARRNFGLALEQVGKVLGRYPGPSLAWRDGDRSAKNLFHK